MNNKTVEDFLLLSCTNLLKWRRPMKVLVKNSKREILLAFWVSIICIIVICLAENEVAKGTAVSFPIELWIDGCNILDFFFPLIVTLPFTWILYYEKKDGFINYAAMRMDKKKYIARKDEDALKALLSKLSRYHTRFSPQAQKVSQKLAIYITEGIKKYD